jgi:hypothetical protein
VTARSHALHLGERDDEQELEGPDLTERELTLRRVDDHQPYESGYDYLTRQVAALETTSVCAGTGSMCSLIAAASWRG